MILLTRLSGKEFYVNAEQVEFAEATPDTVVTMLTGKKLVVRESLAEVVDRMARYHLEVGKSLYQKVLARMLDLSGED